MKQKSAVDWLIEELFPDNEIFGISEELIQQAKEMENQKQQKYNEMLEMLEELCNDTETWSHLFPSQQEKIEQLIKEATEIKNK
jgi:ATP phosphoribosyltransferase